MSSGWAAVAIAGLAQAAAVAAFAWRAGRNDGALHAILDELRRITADHEQRLRVIEGGGPITPPAAAAAPAALRPRRPR